MSSRGIRIVRLAKEGVVTHVASNTAGNITIKVNKVGISLDVR